MAAKIANIRQLQKKTYEHTNMPKKVYLCGLEQSGCGAVGLAHLHGVQGVVRSSRITPTFNREKKDTNRCLFCLYT